MYIVCLCQDYETPTVIIATLFMRVFYTKFSFREKSRLEYDLWMELLDSFLTKIRKEFY